MPKYSTALGGGLAGIMKSMMAGQQGAKIGADTATKDAYMMAQMGNLDASGQTKLAKAAADTFRTDAQSALFNDPTRRTERALELNGVLGGDAQQIQQIIADPKLMETFGDELGMSRDQLSRIQRTRGMLANQYELTGDTNADQFTQGLNTALERGDFEGVLARPETALAMNVAQAAKDGELFDAVGDTGLTLNKGTGDQVVGNAPVYQAGLGKTQSESRENNAQADRHDRATDSGAPGFLGKPPAGYRWAMDGSLEPIPGGPASGAGGSTDGERNAAGFYERMMEANSLLDANEAEGKPNLVNAVSANMPIVGSFAERSTMTPVQQQYKNAAMAWIRAKLRKESGAAIGNDEAAREYETYFPMVNDSEEVLRQKRGLRETATTEMKLSAGRARQKPAAQGNSQPAKIRNIPAATDWLAKQNIQTQEQARKAAAELTAKGWSREEIERAFDGAGL